MTFALCYCTWSSRKFVSFPIKKNVKLTMLFCVFTRGYHPSLVLLGMIYCWSYHMIHILHSKAWLFGKNFGPGSTSWCRTHEIMKYTLTQIDIASMMDDFGELSMIIMFLPKISSLNSADSRHHLSSSSPLLA